MNGASWAEMSSNRRVRSDDGWCQDCSIGIECGIEEFLLDGLEVLWRKLLGVGMVDLLVNEVSRSEHLISSHACFSVSVVECVDVVLDDSNILVVLLVRWCPRRDDSLIERREIIQCRCVLRSHSGSRKVALLCVVDDVIHETDGSLHLVWESGNDEPWSWTCRFWLGIANFDEGTSGVLDVGDGPSLIADNHADLVSWTCVCVGVQSEVLIDRDNTVS